VLDGVNCLWATCGVLTVGGGSGGGVGLRK